MSRIIKIIILEAVVIIVLLLLVLFLPNQKSIAKVCFQENCFTVEVADTVKKQQQGLMFRENLERDSGMIFVFAKEGNYPFWMKDTLIPLDIIWINKNQEVVFIKENADPCAEICESIDPKQNAKYVLELNGGLIDNLGLKLGEKVSISY